MKQPDNRGVSVVEVLLIVVIIGLLGFIGWAVWQNRDKKAPNAAQDTKTAVKTHIGQKQYRDSAGLYTFAYPSNWHVTPSSECCKETTPDWTKVSRPLELKSPLMHDGLTSGAMYIDTATAEATIASARKDKFHTVTDMTINGNKAVYDRLDFVGPSNAEKYLDHYYYIFHGDTVLRLNFRERYYHASPKEEWNAAKDLPAFKQIVQSVRFSQ